LDAISLIPLIYAAVAAASFGAQSVLTMRSLSHMDSQTCTTISMGTCVLVFWSVAPFQLQKEYFSNPGILVFAANGLIHPLLSMSLSFKANKIMGATVSTTIASLAPLFASLGAIAFLGEHLTYQILLGTLGTVVGVVVLSWKREGPFNWSLPALVFPLGASIIRGSNHVVAKVGLGMLPSPFFAALVSFTISFAGAMVIYRIHKGTIKIHAPWQGFSLSVIAGLCIVIGVLSMYAALKTGLVIAVSPVISTFPLFTFLISLLFRQESLTFRVFWGVLLVVGGVILISYQH